MPAPNDGGLDADDDAQPGSGAARQGVGRACPRSRGPRPAAKADPIVRRRTLGRRRSSSRSDPSAGRGDAGHGQGMDIGPGGRRPRGPQDEAAAVRQRMLTVGKRGLASARSRRAGCHGEEADGGPHVPRGDGAEVVVTRLVDRCVGVLGVGDGAHDALGLGRRAEVVELPGRPLAGLVAGPVVGGVARGVELREERLELGHGGGVAAHEGGLSAARSWGTDQVYWTALPSSKPGLAAGFELGRLEGRPRREAAVVAAGPDVAGGGVEQVLPVGGALLMVEASARVVLRGGDLGDGRSRRWRTRAWPSRRWSSRWRSGRATRR